MRLRIKIPYPIRIEKLTEIMKINGVSVYVHWSVFAIGAVAVFNVWRHPILTLVGFSAWLSVMFIHECGHMIAAHRRGCGVLSIALYPIFGVTRFEIPWSRFDHCVIAWGGVLAQAIVAIPFVAWVVIFGYTRFEPMNAVLALLGFYSLFVAAVNLIPAAPLDGAIAWQIVPAFISRWRERRKRMALKYRSQK